MAINGGYVYEFAVEGVSDGQAINNVLHAITVDLSPVDNDVPLASLLGRFRQFWRDEVLMELPTAYTVLRYTLREYVAWVPSLPPPPPAVQIDFGHFTQGAWLELKGSGTAADDGQRAGAWSPTYQAVTVRKRVLKAGKKYRGSMRLGPILEADTEATMGNRLTDARFADFEGIASAVMGLWTATEGTQSVDFRFAVFHKAYTMKHGGPGGPARFLADAIDIASINRYVGSQVSRKRANSLL